MFCKLRRCIFLGLNMVFVWIILFLFVPSVRNLYQGLLPFILFAVLGVVLLVSAYKSKLNKKHQKFLIITGFSAMSMMVGVLLHNLFYALGVKFEHISWFFKITELLQIFFFLFALVLSPLGFIIGVMGSFLTHKKFSKTQ